jgi:putative hydrolase of the HAD superfamily
MQFGCHRGLLIYLITVVTFDLWNTLISDMNYADSRVGYLVKVLNEHGVSRDHEEVRDAYVEAHEYAHQISVDENYRHVSCLERMDYTLKRLSVDLPRNQRQYIVKTFEETILEKPPPLVKDAKNVLEKLSSDYRMGIISDTGITPGRILRLVLEDANVLGFFKATIFSDETGYNKPHKVMFETALNSLGGKPSEAVHIGDLLETDVAGAQSIGMKIVWLNRDGLANTGQYVPDFEISKLPNLLDILS